MNDGRWLTLGALVGLTGLTVAASGSRGAVRRGRSGTEGLVPSSGDAVDRWPDRYAIRLSPELTVVLAVGSTSGRLSTRDPASWLIASIDPVDGPNEDVLRDLKSSMLSELVVRGELEEWETPQWDVERAHGRKIVGKQSSDDTDAAILALRRGFVLARVPDNLVQPYYRWYLLHPMPQDQTWWSVERSHPANQAPVLEALLRGARRLPPGFTVPHGQEDPSR